MELNTSQRYSERIYRNDTYAHFAALRNQHFYFFYLLFRISNKNSVELNKSRAQSLHSLSEKLLLFCTLEQHLSKFFHKK